MKRKPGQPHKGWKRAAAKTARRRSGIDAEIEAERASGVRAEMPQHRATGRQVLSDAQPEEDWR